MHEPGSMLAVRNLETYYGPIIVNTSPCPTSKLT